MSILTPTSEAAQRCLSDTTAGLRRVGLEINEAKTKLMANRFADPGGQIHGSAGPLDL